jgi:cold-inducible RNA-binding protein
LCRQLLSGKIFSVVDSVQLLSLVREKSGPWNRTHGSRGLFTDTEVAVATKLFVGNLSFHTTSPDLEDLFSQVGTVASASVITDKFTGKSRGFAFVEMADEQEAQRAIERFHGTELQGRTLTVNEAKPQPERSGGGRSSFGGRGGGGWNKPSGGKRERRW